MLTLKDGVKKYQDFTLGKVNIEINDGELISIIGKSGSGKSTLIKIIAGFEKLTTGSINYQNTQKKDILYIPQNGTTFNHLNIRQNLNLQTKFNDEDIKMSLSKVGLAPEYIDKYPFQLSGGERQRVDLARAILSSSKLIILDESMSALDQVNKKAITTLIRKLVIDTKLTVIFVTHDEKQATDYSTRIIRLDTGKIVEDINNEIKEQL